MRVELFNRITDLIFQWNHPTMDRNWLKLKDQTVQLLKDIQREVANGKD